MIDPRWRQELQQLLQNLNCEFMSITSVENENKNTSKSTTEGAHKKDTIVTHRNNYEVVPGGSRSDSKGGAVARNDNTGPGNKIAADNKGIKRGLSNTAKEKVKTSRKERPSSIINNNDEHWGPPRTVDICRSGSQNLGFNITVASNNNQAIEGVEIENKTGIFIKSLVDGSPAAALGCLKVGDRILAVGDVDMRTASHGVAVEAIRRAGNKVTLTVQSLLVKQMFNKETMKINYEFYVGFIHLFEVCMCCVLHIVRRVCLCLD